MVEAQESFYRYGPPTRPAPVNRELAEQSQALYAREIRGIVRALWNGTLDWFQAFDLFRDTVRIGLTVAWHAGLASVGMQPSDMTQEEQSALRMAIAQEDQRIAPFLDDVFANNKESGTLLRVHLQRAKLWAIRYQDVMNRARLMAQNDPKLEWVLGPTEKHCRTCPAMNGKVKRSSYWRNSGPHPQRPPNNTIECGGWRCLCTLQPTDAPLSRGPLPKWP